MTTHVEALVIGGGPVGLFAALSLLDRGVSVEVLDAAGERAVRGYACGLHPGTSRALDRLGLMPAILEAGHRVDRLLLHDGSGVIATAAFDTLPGKYPYALTLRQFDLEEALEVALQRLGLKVHRHHLVTELHHGDGFVNVRGHLRPIAGGLAERSSTQFPERRAQYVIGSDGYFSACRRALGVNLTTVRPPKAFAVCEFLADLKGWEREAHVTMCEDFVNAFWPLGGNLGRFTFEIWTDLDQPVSLERLRELIRERAPWFKPNPEQLCWAAVAPFEHRLAERFGRGRIWMAGDAAHSTSPIGFQSMNRGFREVESLSQSIATELFAKGHHLGLFQDFERAQQGEWLRLFGLRPDRSHRNANATQLASCMPASGDDFELLMAQLVGSARRLTH
jgi:2-polyprenyl-6-methoxyphenol hydroxylase-like FAD-dependent oxidoreductase